jgi:hypothetical protein
MMIAQEFSIKAFGVVLTDFYNFSGLQFQTLGLLLDSSPFSI